MNDRDPKLIREMISRFHGKRFSGRVKKNFHLWLISPQDYTAKDEAMAQVWDGIAVSASSSVYKSLKTVKVKLGMVAEPKSTVSLRRVMVRVAAVLLPAVLMIGSYFIYTVSSDVEWTLVEVAYGETGHYELTDGTQVWLNSGSTLEYPVKFRGGKREVRLDGEGFFDVAPNKRKPFIVKTDNMYARVVGTQFNIACYDNMKQECVTVLEGQVNVTTGDEKTYELVADRHLTHWIEKHETQVETVDAQAMIRWRNNGLVFDNSTYEDILYALQRKYNISIDVDPAYMAAGSLYRMQFVNDESLDYILNIVHSVVGLPYRFENGVLTVEGSPNKETEK